MMPYFMIAIDTEAWDNHCFEVYAETSGKALVKVLERVNALSSERVLYSIHIGAKQENPTTDEEIQNWDEEDRNHFERIS